MEFDQFYFEVLNEQIGNGQNRRRQDGSKS